MYSVTIRFYEELNDFLPRERRKRDIDIDFPDRRSIKDLIESFGVPHVEVDLILVNGVSVDFGYIVGNGDRISVYPVFERFDVQGVTRLRKTPLRDITFILDVHLRKLARMLRLLGFDVAFSESLGDAELAGISSRERRVLLTRDRQLLMRRNVERGLYVRNTDPRKQLVEILDRLDLRSSCKPFTRCIECNGGIVTLDYDAMEQSVRDLIPPGVRVWCREFYRCASCKRIYWKGSHYEKLSRFVKETLAADPHSV